MGVLYCVKFKLTNHMKKNKAAWGQYGTANVEDVYVFLAILEWKIVLCRLATACWGDWSTTEPRERANMQSPYPVRSKRETSSMTDMEAIIYCLCTRHAYTGCTYI